MPLARHMHLQRQVSRHKAEAAKVTPGASWVQQDPLQCPTRPQDAPRIDAPAGSAHRCRSPGRSARRR